MIWGAIGFNHLVGSVVFQGIGPGRGNGVTAQRYINQVLRPQIVPYFQRHNHLTFRQDNTRPHTTRVTTASLHQNNVRVMPWPSLSPDMNPIEHFGDILQRELNAFQTRPTNARQLEQAIRQIYPTVNMATVYRQALVNANGNYIHYNALGSSEHITFL